MRLQAKTALIAGGSSAIGLATAHPLTPKGVVRFGRLFVLELSGDRVHLVNPDGSDRKTIAVGTWRSRWHKRNILMPWFEAPSFSCGS